MPLGAQNNEAPFWDLVQRHMGSQRHSPEQKAAIAAPDGPVLVDAGPGAGKTAVLAWRVVYLWQVRGVRPQQVIVVTFTKSAAQELKKRIAALAGQDLPVHISTIHALAWKLLRRAGGQRLHWLPEHVALAVIADLLRKAGVGVGDDTPAQVFTEMGLVRNRMLRWSEYEAQSVNPDLFRRVAEAYAAWKRTDGRLDFDDMLEQCLALLQRSPAAWPGGVSHLLVDEFQDTSLLQYHILRKLAEPRRCLYVVGDVDQGIYSWRGAGPDVMLRFPQDYPDCTRLVLHDNYRATSTLVEVTNRLIRENRDRFDKQIRPVRPAGPVPQVIEPAHDAAEAGRVAEQLLQWRRRERIPWGQMAVLYRRNHQALVLVAELNARKIPFVLLSEPPNPFRHWVGRDIIAYLRLALGERSAGLLSQIIYRPNRYIPKAATDVAALHFAKGVPLPRAYLGQGLAEYQMARLRELEEQLAALRDMPAGEAVAFVWDTVGYRSWTEDATFLGSNAPVEARAMYAMLYFLAQRFNGLHEFVELAESVEKDLTGWWRRIAPQDAGAAGAAPQDAVRLTTCHSAKGLEFDAVAVAGLVETVLPGNPDDPQAVEEERRLAYVAMTRARRHLLLSAPRMLLGEIRSRSRFIDEALGGWPPPETGGAGPSRSPAADLTPARLAARFAAGDRIAHTAFGQGTVVAVDAEAGILSVRFDSGYETKLLIQTCIEQGLLQPLEAATHARSRPTSRTP